MPTPDPVEAAINGRDEADIIGYLKERQRESFADPDEVAQYDLSGRFAGIYVRSLRANFDLNTESTQVPDGVNVLQDGGGNIWERVAVTVDLAERTVTAAGAIAGAATDVIVLVDKTADEDTDYNAVASATFTGDELTLKDLKGNASTHRLRFVPNGTEKVDGADYFDITRDHGFVTVRPKAAGGWYVRSSSE